MKKEKSSEKRRIQFEYDGYDAHQVWLVGDFNKWDEKKHPMKKSPDGIWKKTIVISPGRYEYKFKVDQDWVPDPVNQHRCMNEFGTFNCIIYVK